MATELRDLLSVLARLNTDSTRQALDDVAVMAHLSPSRAQRVFTRIVGESPGRYQQRVALDRAAADLASTDATVIDVAFTNGFGSHEGFTRAFRTRFGLPPRAYRDRADADWSEQHRSHVNDVAPCIGLYRHTLTSNANQHAKESAMSHEITVRTVEPTPVLLMARRVDKDELAAAFAEVLPAVFGYVMENGLAMAGPPYVRYVEQSAAFCSIEGGIPLASAPEPPDAETGITAGELPGGEVVTTIHHGPYDTLGEGHIALDRWMAEHGRTPAGGPWEVYLTDPGEVPDPNDWQTEILWPMQ